MAARNKKKPRIPNVEVNFTKTATVPKKKKVTDYPVELTDLMEERNDEEIISIKEGTDEYVIVSRDPYHWCYIEGPKLPPAMQGAYTTYTAAKEALDTWLSTKE